MRSRLFVVGLFGAVASLGGCAAPEQQNANPRTHNAHAQSETRRLSREEAILRAEEFVIGNGYTDLPPRVEAADLSREGIDDTDPARRLEARRHSLRRRACGVFPTRVLPEAPGWTVVFCRNPKSPVLQRSGLDPESVVKERGRGVVMNPSGDEMRMLHVDISLQAPDMVRLQ